VWWAEDEIDKMARVDPATGKVEEFNIPDVGGHAFPRRMNTDANGDWRFVNRLAVHPTQPNVLLAALTNASRATGAVYRSTDAGATWHAQVSGTGQDLGRVHFANALTTNLTSFFREPHHFPMLIEHLRARPAGTPAVIWSAACSTGEEPYSIAMAVHEAGEEVSRGVRIIASDLDTVALDTARRAIYPLERAATVGEERLRRFFLRGGGSRDGKAKVRPDVGAMVEFRHINLAAPRWPIDGPLEAIFCRNAMIYFAKPMQLAVLRRFCPLLAGGGLLFAGHSENFHYLAGDFLRTRGKTVYGLVD